MEVFLRVFGSPTNEPERYFYNAASEVIARGGQCIMTKLPYDNLSKDKFTYTDYILDDTLVSTGTVVNDISSIDEALTSYVTIRNDDKDDIDSTLTIEQLDDYIVNYSRLKNDVIRIVDRTRGKYGSVTMQKVGEDGKIRKKTMECTGIMPVLVSPTDAMFFQGVISTDTLFIDDSSSNSIDNRAEHSIGIENYNPISSFCTRNMESNGKVVLSDLTQFDSVNFVVEPNAGTIDDVTVSKLAADTFPRLNFVNSNTIEKRYLKSVGLVVFAAALDEANENKLNFIPLEAYVGTLGMSDIDPKSGSSTYIGNMVNDNSQYVYFFSNVKKTKNFKDASTIHICNQKSKILGFLEAECDKNITLQGSILEPMSTILSRCEDPNLVQFDLVLDAGMSNIAQFAYLYDSNYSKDPAWINADNYPYPNGGTWSIGGAPGYDGTKGWQTVLKKFDEFCKYKRRDCMFLADGLRPFCLEQNDKIVRNQNRVKSIAQELYPRLKLMSGTNSSYSAGYCNWFHAYDDYSGDAFWCPPSIKAAGVYTYSDRYFSPWSAPAGLNRGHVRNVFDVAFNPMNDEAGKIYQQAWNYAISYPINGIVLEGQKTFQIQKTALDRVNVRRLMLHLEKQVIRVARRFLYEQNTEYNRQRFVDTITPFFQNAVNGEGIQEYAIRCDSTINTDQTIENHELHCIIAVKPVKTIEYIVLNFVTTSQSANVQEEVMNA